MARTVVDVGYEQADTEYVQLDGINAATVTLDGNYSSVEVVNLGDGAGAPTADVFATVDGAAPEVRGAGSKVIPAPVGASLVLRSPDSSTTIVQLIAAAQTWVGVAGLVA